MFLAVLMRNVINANIFKECKVVKIAHKYPWHQNYIVQPLSVLVVNIGEKCNIWHICKVRLRLLGIKSVPETLFWTNSWFTQWISLFCADIVISLRSKWMSVLSNAIMKPWCDLHLDALMFWQASQVERKALGSFVQVPLLVCCPWASDNASISFSILVVTSFNARSWFSPRTSITFRAL